METCQLFAYPAYDLCPKPSLLTYTLSFKNIWVLQILLGGGVPLMALTLKQITQNKAFCRCLHLYAFLDIETRIDMQVAS